MKKVYILLSVISISLFSCVKNYEETIIGNWKLEDVDRVGIGNSSTALQFIDGYFNFSEGGELTYTTLDGTVYQGSWQLRNGQLIELSDQVLDITVVNFSSQDIKTETFTNLYFTSDNKFKAYVNSGSNSHVYFFERN